MRVTGGGLSQPHDFDGNDGQDTGCQIQQESADAGEQQQHRDRERTVGGKAKLRTEDAGLKIRRSVCGRANFVRGTDLRRRTSNAGRYHWHLFADRSCGVAWQDIDHRR